MAALLLNILIIILSLYAYQLLVIGKLAQEAKRNRLAIAILCSIALIACMTFRLGSATDYRYDLRAIPFLISIFYGGFASGLATTCVLVLFRWLLGGTGVLLTVVTYPLIFLFALPLIKPFNRWRLPRKTFVMLCFTAATVAPISVSALLATPTKSSAVIEDAVGYYLLTILAAGLLVVLIENLRETVKMRLEIRRSEKMHVISELAASIAHEIRNPMTVARGFAQLLSDTDLPKDKHQTYLAMIQDELDRAHVIINDYLSLAAPDVNKSEKVAIDDEVLRVTELLSAYAHLHGVQMDNSVESAGVVLGDSQKFDQALINIIKNAIEAMPQGGVIKLRAAARGPSIEVQVTDSGKGMTREQLGRLGTPFYSTKDGGTGLGLMTSFRIIEAMDGKIEVASEVGKGSSFTIRLPLALEQSVRG